MIRDNIVCINGKHWLQGEEKIIPTPEEIVKYFQLEDKYKVIPCTDGQGYEVITKFFSTKFPNEHTANAHRRSLIIQEINSYLEAIDR